MKKCTFVILDIMLRLIGALQSQDYPAACRRKYSLYVPMRFVDTAYCAGVGVNAAHVKNVRCGRRPCLPFHPTLATRVIIPYKELSKLAVGLA